MVTIKGPRLRQVVTAEIQVATASEMAKVRIMPVSASLAGRSANYWVMVGRQTVARPRHSKVGFSRRAAAFRNFIEVAAIFSRAGRRNALDKG